MLCEVCYKIKITFKSQRNLSNVFRFKDRLPCGSVSCCFSVVDAILYII